MSNSSKIKVLDPKEFCDSLDDHDLYLFVAVLQEQRRTQIEPMVTKLVNTGGQENYLLFMHLYFDNGIRYLSVELSIWWDCVEKHFSSRLVGITEFENEFDLCLINRVDRILNEAINQNQEQ